MTTRFGNRELSWLDFNERVLRLANEESIPLLERIKFLAIFSSNLDEFFQVRVAGLKGQVAGGVGASSPDGLSPRRQLAEITRRVRVLVEEHERHLLDVLLPSLNARGFTLCRWDDLSQSERNVASNYFDREVFPLLTPLAVDPAHPFPYVSNLALNLGVLIRHPLTREERFARIKVPTFIRRFHEIVEGRFVPVEDIVAANMQELFLGMEVVHVCSFRVSRNADLALEDEDAEDLLAAVEMELRRRRFGQAVRLEVSHDVHPDVLETLLDELGVDADDVYLHRAPLGLASLWELHGADRPDLQDVTWPSVTAGRFAAADGNDQSMFSVLRHRDLLVHHPYESFSSSTEEFIEQAANDPKVRVIKITLYRLSGDSPIARSLITAAEQGKQVVALIELTARFDEEVNVNWARQLERAGVHVVYGVVGLKTHCKCVLVVRHEESRLRRYVHLGTGNYNSRTARTYEDIGLFSCDDEIGEDVSQLFNALTGFSHDEQFAKLIVAPRDLRSRVVELISNETRHGSNGHIVMKLNALADKEIVELLYAASDAGVKIDIIVRGICCLRPFGSHRQNIRVRSVLGRYLEHSRMYRFAHGDPHGGPIHLFGSADMMPRNLDRRVEVLLPVEHSKHVAWMDEVFDTLLADDVVAFEMDHDGSWHRVGPLSFAAEHDAQARIHERVVEQQMKRGTGSKYIPSE